MNLKNSPYKIYPLKSFNKEITLPSSKSHSNRALILGAIKGEGFKVYNVSPSTDVINLIACFKKIGLRMEFSGSTLTFENSFPVCEQESIGEVIELPTGDGGTTNRFLIALLSRGKKEYRLFPTEKMSERPIEDLIIPLKKLNIYIAHNSEKIDGKAWVTIKGPASLSKTTKLEIDCQKSTQFASALMLAFSNSSLQLEFLNLHASEAYLEMTAQVIKVAQAGNSYKVPVDFSSLSYPAALAALMGQVCIKNCSEIDPFQADAVFIEMLEISGAHQTLSSQGLEIKKGAELKPFSFNVAKAPDLFPTLVFLAAHIEGESFFSDLHVLKFKESDRLMQMIQVLQAFKVELNYDSASNILKVIGKSNFTYPAATIHPARDHRIVMATALFMARNSGGELFEVDCVEKSFPSFLSLLD